MATVVFGIIGAGIGAAVDPANPAQGAQWGWAIGTVVGGLLFPPDMPAQSRGKLDDLRVTGSSYGVAIPQAWGYFRFGGQVIWATDLIEHSNTQNAGGKGGSGQEVTSYTYSSSFAVMVCAGPKRIRRIWFNDTIVYNRGSTKLDITCYDGDETQMPDPLMQSALAAQSRPCSAHRGITYFVVENVDVTPYGSRLPNVQVEVDEVDDHTILASEIIVNICKQCGLTDDEIDVTTATDEVIGYCNPTRQMGKAALEPLFLALGADLVEADGVLRYSKRGAAPYKTLSVGECGAVLWDGGQGEDTVTVASTRTQAMELPTKIDVIYYQWSDDINSRNYLQATQSEVRSSKNDLQNTQSFTFPMVMRDTFGKRLAQRLLYTAWVEIDQFTVNLGPRHMDLIPSDIVLVPHGNKLRRCRVVTIDMSLPGQIQVALVKDDWSVMHQYGTGGLTGGIGNRTDSAFTLSQWAWESEAFTDDLARKNILHLWLAAAGPQGWGGCAVYGSLDGGASYQLWVSKNIATTMGVCTSILGDWADYTTVDTTNTLTVVSSRGALVSCSTADINAGVNAMMVGGELVQFQTSTPLGADSYELSNFVRGRRGTDDKMHGHSGGELFAVVDSHLQIKEFTYLDIGRTLMVKFVPYGSSLALATAHTITLTGAEFAPWSVDSVSGSRSVPLDLTVVWSPRPRWAGAPVPDSPEVYDVEVWDSTYTTLVRTFAGLTASTVDYLAADQTADFGAAQPVVYIRIYQISDVVGRGHVYEGNV